MRKLKPLKHKAAQMQIEPYNFEMVIYFPKESCMGQARYRMFTSIHLHWANHFCGVNTFLLTIFI